MQIHFRASGSRFVDGSANYLMNEDLLKKACEQLLQQLFPLDFTRVVSICSVEGRSNIHKMVVLEGGQEFGFKCWSAAKPVDGGEEGCAERDSKLNEIAHLVKAPNVCEVKYTQDLDCEPFSKRIVAISKWIPDSKSMDRMDDTDLEEIRKSAECFFRKYGEWVALGEAMGFRDWTDNNFVWSHKSHAMALIDMDWSFNCGLESDYDYQAPIKRLRPIAKHLLDKIACEFVDGVESMQLKLTAQSDRILTLLSNSSLEELRNFKPIVDAQLKDRTSRELKQYLGRLCDFWPSA